MRSFRLLRRPAAPTAFAYWLGVILDAPASFGCILRLHNEAYNTTIRK